jgi:hypothetical protein
MGKGLIAFLFGVGLAGWVYSKTQQTTGGDSQRSMIAGGAVGFVGMLIMLLVLSFIPGL